MTQFLPPNLLALFAPRDPVPFLPPADKLPHEKKTVGYAGVGPFLCFFEDPKNTPPPTRIETREERQERKRREKAEQVAYKLEQDIALWDPQNSPVATTDPYKTLFIARINYDTSEQKLRREFEVYGSIRKIVLVHDKDNGRGRGYAFIEYEHERDMHSAYKHADGKKIDGRRVLVDVERGRIVKGWLPRRLGGGLGGTRRGGPEVNVKHSGREDSRLDERYLGPCRDRDGGRGERDRAERNNDRPERPERDRGERPERVERDRDREREKRRSRSRSRERKRRGSRSRSPREVREPREPRENRERHRERRKHREPREPREPERNHDRSTEKSDSMDGVNNVAPDGETPTKRDRERKRSRSRERDRERKRRRSRSRSRERKRRDRDHRGDRDDRREKDRGDKDERNQRDEDRILREDEIKQEVTQDGYSNNGNAYDGGDNFAFESKPIIPYETYNDGEEYTPYEAENYNNE